MTVQETIDAFADRIGSEVQQITAAVAVIASELNKEPTLSTEKLEAALQQLTGATDNLQLLEPPITEEPPVEETPVEEPVEEPEVIESSEDNFRSF